MEINKTIKIYDENKNLINNSKIEVWEQKLTNKYINKDDIVLELGARYGSVSCTINDKLKNKYNQVSVEPDDRVWEALENNKIINNCEFNIVKGFISKKKMELTNKNVWLNGYGSTFIYDNKSKIPNFTLDEIKKKYHLKFNVLVADCEGFLEVFLRENPELFVELRMIIFEADHPLKCNYKFIKETLKKYNFYPEFEYGKQNVYVKL